MDVQTVSMIRWIASYVIALAVIMLGGALGAMYMVIVLLPDGGLEKVAIVAGISTAIGGGLTLMLGAIAGAFVIIMNSRKNISVSDAEGKPPETP